MASLYKKPVIQTHPKTGKRIKTKSKKWWGRYRAANGTERRVPLAADKTAAQTMLNELVRKAEREAAGITDPFEANRKRPLVEHLTDFKRHLENKGSSKNHILTTHQRASAIVNEGGFKTIGDISASRVLDVLAAKRKKGMSVVSSNHYLRAIKMFSRWLVADRRSNDDRVAHISSLNQDIDRRRIRRPLSTEEFNVLIEKTAFNKQRRPRPSGPDRALIYVVAVYTGLRRNEIASITPASFSFDSTPPTITVEAGYSKRRQKDILPLRRDFAERLRQWIAQKPNAKATDRLFPVGGRRTSDMLQKDLKFARAKWIEEAESHAEQERRKESSFLEYEDCHGHVVDFHSLRKTFITNLTRSGVTPKTAQLLARHSDINLTMNTYTSLGVLDQAAAVEALPPVPGGNPQSPASALPLRATGTDGQDQRPGATKKVPVLVPRGAENGAKRTSSGTIRLATDCTETGSTKRPTRRIAVNENPEKNGPIRTRKGQSASRISSVPEGGLEPPLSCENWILSPARLPIPPLRRACFLRIFESFGLGGRGFLDRVPHPSPRPGFSLWPPRNHHPPPKKLPAVSA